MNEEQARILRIREEEKTTSQEANKLLDTLESYEPTNGTKPTLSSAIIVMETMTPEFAPIEITATKPIQQTVAIAIKPILL